MNPIILMLTTHLPETYYSIVPLALMLAAQAIPTAVNLGKAYVQGRQAKKLLQDNPRPNYDIPQGLQDAVQQARYIAGMRELPGQNLMENRLGANLGTGVAELKNVSSNPSDLSSNIARLYSGQNQSINDIGMAAGQNWLNNQSGLQAALGQLAKAQDKQWTINKYEPYENAMAAASALKEGSFRNLSAAGQNIASGLIGGANLMQSQDFLNQILGKQDLSGVPNTADTAANTGINAAANALKPKVGLSQAISSPNLSNYNQMTPEQQDELLNKLFEGIGGSSTKSFYSPRDSQYNSMISAVPNTTGV